MKAEETTRIGRGPALAPPLITYPLLFIFFVVFMVVLSLLKSILIPFALAVFLAYILFPAVKLLTKLKIPYGLAVGVVLLLFLGVFLAAGIIIGGEISGFIQALPQYQETLKQYVESVSSAYSSLVEKFAAILPGEPAPGQTPAHAPSIISGIIGKLFSGLISVFSILSDFVLVFFFLVFLLAGAKNFKTKLIGAWSSREENKVAGIVEAINEGIGGYIIIRSAINLGLAIVLTVVFLIFKIDYAYVWGPLTGILNFIPYIGAFLAVIPPVVVALFQYDSYWTAVILLLIIIVIQNIEGNILTPFLIGKRVNLNPLAVLMGLILWGFIWGPVGMILATPLTTCFKILCDHIEPLKPIGSLLGSDVKKQ
ncbi:MAG: AI-2E family transporter [Candidatus Euphemobacter frigidus]|nr:AI-2E family transporter [Candidatus Euphemobacter frigidus]MDP8276236.1 AI-2E family transporter [Candidatus Euphemobacter frigidus]